MLLSVRPCRPHTRLSPPGLLWVPFLLETRSRLSRGSRRPVRLACQLRLRPGRLPQVLQIPPRGGHPTAIGYGPYPVGPAGLAPAREQYCRALASKLSAPKGELLSSRTSGYPLGPLCRTVHTGLLYTALSHADTQSSGTSRERVKAQTVIKEGIRISPPVRGAPASGHEGPQSPEEPAIEASSQWAQVANTEVPPPAPKHGIQHCHDLIHPTRLPAPRDPADLVS
jgi:hypothetical protein